MKNLKKPRIPNQLSPEQQKEWNSILASEGMPEELPPEIDEMIQNSESASFAVREYVMHRATQANSRYLEGEHEAVAIELSRKFGIDKNQAKQLIEDALEHPPHIH